MEARGARAVLTSRAVSTGKLTRQELGWLLTQEAQGAALSLLLLAFLLVPMLYYVFQTRKASAAV